ncbi:MAG: MATE family efflux transporter [Lachnospiraceae bacterium]|nr:MATE family efflux transporter [Lachnospiraceae bacterium]
MAKTLNFEGKLVDDPVDHKLGTMPVLELLFKMSIPMMISMFMLALYNLVDSIFVAQISEAALSALSLAYPVQFLMVSLNIGTSVGVTALISRSLGEKNFENANDYARHGLFLSIVYFIISAIIGYFFADDFFYLMTSDPDIRRDGITYLSIIMIFSTGFYVETTYEKMMQATGKSVSSMITQLSGAIFNIIFDPILIFGLFGFPAMGVKGAAIATVAGQYFGTVVGYFLNKYTNNDLKLNFFSLKLDIKKIINIYIIGIPSIVMQAIGSFTILGLNAILTKYESAVAVLGSYYKVQSFVLMPIFGLNNGMVPIVSYNFGSHNKKRITKVIKVALIAAFIIMIIGGFFVFFGAEFLLKLFNASDNMMKVGVYAFKVIAIHYPLISFNIILSSVMQATKKEVYSLIASVIRQIVFLLPSAYILSMFFGVNGVWFCFLISEFAAFLVVLHLFKKTYDSKIATL